MITPWLDPVGLVKDKVIWMHMQYAHEIKSGAHTYKLFYLFKLHFSFRKIENSTTLPCPPICPILVFDTTNNPITRTFSCFYMRPNACPRNWFKYINAGRNHFFCPKPNPPLSSKFCYGIFTVHWVGVSKTIILISTRIHPWRVVKNFPGGFSFQ